MRYKNDAESLISKLAVFDKPAFEAWVLQQNILVGAGHVLQFSEEARRWNTKPAANSEARLNISYSKQALSIIEKLKEFDYIDFSAWFSNALEIERGDILNYLEATYKK